MGQNSKSQEEKKMSVTAGVAWLTVFEKQMWIGNCKKTGKFTAKMCCGSPWYLEIYKSGLSGCLSLRLPTVQFITGVTTSPWCVSRSLWFKLWCSLVTVMILLAAVDRASCTTERQFVLPDFCLRVYIFHLTYVYFVRLCVLWCFVMSISRLNFVR